MQVAKWLCLLVLCLVLALPRPGWAEDAALAEMRAVLVPLRVTAPPDTLPFHPPVDDPNGGLHGDPSFRGAVPALMTVKHRLRDWVESRLAALDHNGDFPALAVHLNDELRAAGLFCEDRETCGANEIGYLGPISLERQQFGKIAVLTTRLGILCAADASGYVYERRDQGWQRLWQNEQDIVPGQPYRPQYIIRIGVSGRRKGTEERVVMLLGHEGWCSSNFYNVYFSLWGAGPGHDARPMLTENRFAYLGRNDPPIDGSTGPNDALIEFTVTSRDVGVHSYEAIYHYEWEDDRPVRVAPIALFPGDFVEEWLSADWPDAVRWGAARLQKRHADLKTNGVSGEYLSSKQCDRGDDQWQVGFALSAYEGTPRSTYFRLRWQAPYRFQMMDIRDKPWPDCRREGPFYSDSIGTLFPTQDWR